MLLQGKKQRQISQDLGVGIATVTRGAQAFENEKLFKIKSDIIDILKSDKKHD
jgi:Trp operon repressor